MNKKELETRRYGAQSDAAVQNNKKQKHALMQFLNEGEDGSVSNFQSKKIGNFCVADNAEENNTLVTIRDGVSKTDEVANYPTKSEKKPISNQFLKVLNCVKDVVNLYDDAISKGNPTNHVAIETKKEDTLKTYNGDMWRLKRAAIVAALAGLTTFGVPAWAEDVTSDFLDKYNTSGTREFTFSSADDVVNVTSNLPAMAAGTFTVTGVIDGAVRSTINFKTDEIRYNGFVTYPYSTLYIENVEFINSNGAAIYYNRSGGSVLNSKFVSNNCGIYVNYATMSSITNSIFESNTASMGGAVSVYNNGGLNTISSSIFINNASSDYGGALFLARTLNALSDSHFTYNSAARSGGAIHGAINVISNSTFTSNVARGWYSGDGGGAINGNITNITNSVFTNNFTNREGGAIKTGGSLNIISDNGITTFQGNKQGVTFTGDVPNPDTGVSNAIYMNKSGGTITFDQKNGGETYMYDAIDGNASGYNVVIKNTGDSDSTGTFYMYNDMTGANVTTSTTGNTVNIDLSDDTTKNISMKTLTSDDTALYKIDFNGSTTPSADSITTTASGSSGTVYINDINFYGLTGSETAGYTQTAQVLNLPDNALQLALNAALTSDHELGQVVKTVQVEIEPDWTYYTGQKIGEKDVITTYTGNYSLATSAAGHDNDSIKMTVTAADISENWITTQDILNAWITQTTSDPRYFRFSSAEDVYTVTTAPSQMTGGTFNVIGVYDANSGNRSVIDFQDTESVKHSGFVIASGSTLNLSNVELKNANGSTINNLGIVNIDNSKFSSNTAYKGAAIYNYGGISQVGNITNSEFVSNTATAYGGAIYNSEYAAHFLIGDIINSKFISNSAAQDGGAIFNNAGAEIGDIIGSTFTSNSAKNGGAIYNLKYPAQPIIGDITNSQFDYNAATANGGAIYNGGTFGTISNSQFTVNTAATSGGAIYNAGTIAGITGTITIDPVTDEKTYGTVFSGNIANGDAMSSGNYGGGAIYNAGTITNGILGVEFTGNTAKNSGGAIYNASGANLGTINNTFFDQNTAATNGGAIYNAGTIAGITGDVTTDGDGNTVYGTIFSGNKAKPSGSAGAGGAIYNDSGTITNGITGVLFDSNSSTGSAGAIYNKAGNISVITADFTNNTAAYNGGAILIAYEGAYIGKIKDSTFTGNKTTGSDYTQGGGVLMNEEAINSIESSVFTSNSTNSIGGAILNRASGKIGYQEDGIWKGGIKNTTFTGNTAGTSGGAIYNTGTIAGITGTITIDPVTGEKTYGTVFSGNKANGTATDQGGGAIYNIGTITNGINGVKFSENTTSGLGGATYNTGTIAIIANSLFSNNSTNTYSGGALYNNGIIANGITNTVFTSNITASNGGAIGNDQAGTIQNVISGIEFSQNVAIKSGGAIYNDGSIAGITGSGFTNNSATNNDGGAIYNSASGTIGYQEGGAWKGGISNSTFSGNTAGTSGGAIYNAGTIAGITGTVTTDGDGNKAYSTVFSGNKANGAGDYGGGAIYNSGTITNGISGVLFDSNVSNGRSGAIFNNAGTINNISDSKFENNVGNGAGAIGTSGGSIGTISNSIFIGNIATGYWGISGAVQSRTNGLSIINSSFINNGSTGEGGGLWSSANVSIIADDGVTTFSGNKVGITLVRDSEGNVIGFTGGSSSGIYIGYGSTATLRAINDGVINMYDAIGGHGGYVHGVVLTGDSSGVINLYNNVGGANVSADTVNINLANNETFNYNLNTLTSDANANWTIDLDFTDPVALTSDKFNITNASAGTVTIADINAIGLPEELDPTKVYNFQILNVVNTEGNTLKLALSEAMQEKSVTIADLVQDVTLPANTTMHYGDKVGTGVRTRTFTGAYDLTTTTTESDTLTVAITTATDNTVWSYVDPLNAWLTQNAGGTPRYYYFNTASEEYKVGTNLSTASAGVMNIVGVYDDESGKRSVINFQDDESVKHSGFNIASGSTLNISNVEIKNAEKSGNGGAIYNNGSTVTISNSTFSGNTAADLGGAIYNAGTMNITNSVFENNIAYGYYGRGAAIYSVGGRISISDSIFKNNVAKGTYSVNSAGALSLIDVMTNPTITNSQFIDNVGYEAGGIRSSRSFTIENSEFTGNIGTYGGGAAGAISGNGTITNSTFINNASSGAGGAIYAPGGVTIVADDGVSTFSGNKGGATIVKDSEGNVTGFTGGYSNGIFAGYGSTATLRAINDGVINMYDAIGGHGGYVHGVVLTGDSSGVINLYNNVGGANVSADTVNINLANNETFNYNLNTLTSDASANWTIDVNFGTTGAAGSGSADLFNTIAESTGVIKIAGLNVIGDTAASYADDYKVQIIHNANTDSSLQLALTSDVAQDLEGIYFVGDRGKSETEVAENTTAWDAPIYQYTSFSDYKALSLQTTDTENDSIGVIHVTGGSKVKLDTLNSWLTKDAGGEVRNFNFDSATNVYKVSTNLGTSTAGVMNIVGKYDANADQQRSVIDLQNHSGFNIASGSTLNLSNVEIKNGRRDIDGGAIDTTSNATINISNSKFTNNSSTYWHGGVIYNYRSKIGTITDSIFADNNAYRQGGSIYNVESTIDAISNSTFTSNTANINGGAIVNAGAGAKISTISNSIFTGNTAGTNGGAIYNSVTIGYQEDDVWKGGIKDSTFTGNTAGTSGGAIWNAGTISNIQNSTFTDNLAKTQGGAIYSTKDLLITSDNGTTTFQGNLDHVVKDGEGNITSSNSNAIFMDKEGGTITFDIVNGGSTYLYDAVAGHADGYNVIIKNGSDSASTGTMYLYNDLNNANVTTQAGTGNTLNINTADGNLTDYNFKSLTSDANANWTIDLDFTDPDALTSDKFNITNASSGTVLINELNTIGFNVTTDSLSPTTDYSFKILDVENTEGNTLQLALSDSILGTTLAVDDWVTYESEEATPTIAWNKDVGGTTRTRTYTGNFVLNDAKDSVVVNKNLVSDTSVVTSKIDTLKAWAEKEVSDDKNFNFTTDPEATPSVKRYELITDAGVNPYSGTLNINGEVDSDGNILSTIDANSQKLFTVSEGTTLNINNTEIVDAVSETVGGAINNLGTVNLANAKFTNNTAGTDANDIHNAATLNIKSGTTSITGGITGTGSTNVIGGDLIIADSSNGLSQGALIITSGSVKADADNITITGNDSGEADTITNNGTIEFTGGTNTNALTGTGSTVISGEVVNNALIEQNDLHVKNLAKLNTSLTNVSLSSNTVYNDGTIELENEDEIALDIAKDTLGGGVIKINNTDTTKISGIISDNTIELNSGNLAFSDEANNIAGSNLVFAGNTLNMINQSAAPLTVGTLTLNKDVNLLVDVDLENESMDTLNATLYALNGHKINVTGMNIISDSKDYTTKILFTNNEDVKNNVFTTITEVGKGVMNPYQSELYSPIYKYTVSYGSQPTGGYFTFERPSFNPAVLDTPVAQQSTVLAVQNTTMNYAFHHVDTCMSHSHAHLNPKSDNRYALSGFTDLGTNNPLFVEPEQGTVWVKPFVTFENVPLQNGPKVNSINYGTMIGYDSQHFHHKHGIEGIWTGYVGYNGATMSYPGVDMNSNGGLIGATYSMYKGDFFNATTVTTGAMNNQATTMYGKDNMATLYAGIGNKFGYNLNFKNERFVIQPSLLMSYTFAKTFDYTNAAGVRISSDPVHSIQLSPGIKFYMNTMSGWQPYASVNMMWNVMDKSNVRANDVTLPSLTIKPYVQYGVGIQKTIKGHFTGYGQVMVQNGGRNGVSLTAGFKWAIGCLNGHKHPERNKNKVIPQQVQNTGKGTRHILKG